MTDTRTGSSTTHRAPVLRSPVPHGGQGRALAAAECAGLRALGWHVSRRYRVVRQVDGDGYYGIIYRPCVDGSLVHDGIYVTTTP